MRFTRSATLAAATAISLLSGLVALQRSCLPDEPDDRMAAIVELLDGGGSHEANEGGPSRATLAAAHALANSADVATLVAQLEYGHSTIAAELGPHRLNYIADYLQTPRSPDDKDRAFGLQDRLTLDFYPTPQGLAEFSLVQGNDPERTRELRLIAGTLYSRQAPREWYSHTPDSDVTGLWLDDAAHCVRDFLRFAANAAVIQAREEPGVLIFRLSHRPGNNATPPLGADDPLTSRAGWRDRISVTHVSGDVELDAAKLLWRRAQVELGYTIHDSNGRPVADGRLSLLARIEPIPPDAVRPTAPMASKVLPHRRRPELERQRLLDGLAPS